MCGTYRHAKVNPPESHRDFLGNQQQSACKLKSFSTLQSPQIRNWKARIRSQSAIRLHRIFPFESSRPGSRVAVFCSFLLPSFLRATSKKEYIAFQIGPIDGPQPSPPRHGQGQGSQKSQDGQTAPQDAMRCR